MYSLSMTIRTGHPQVGILAAKGKSYSGELVFGLDGWSFRGWDSDLDFIHRLRFLIDFDVAVTLNDTQQQFVGRGKLARIGRDMLFRGASLREVEVAAGA